MNKDVNLNRSLVVYELFGIGMSSLSRNTGTSSRELYIYYIQGMHNMMIIKLAAYHLSFPIQHQRHQKLPESIYRWRNRESLDIWRVRCWDDAAWNYSNRDSKCCRGDGWCSLFKAIQKEPGCFLFFLSSALPKLPLMVLLKHIYCSCDR